MEEDEPSIDDLVLKYRQFRKKKEDIESESKAAQQVYTDAMETIENYLAEHMHNLKLTSLPTKNGTAYGTTVTSIKITDKGKFLDFALNNHRDLLQFSCNKTAIKDYEEEKNKKGDIIKPARPYPPGLEVTKLKKVNVRGT